MSRITDSVGISRMDLSKLPKLSQPAKSDPPTQPVPAQSHPCPACGAALRAGAKFCDSCGVPVATVPLTYAPIARAGVGAEAWISIAMGAILLIIGPRLIQYLISPSTFPAKWSFSDEQGAPLPYTHSVFFFGDIALTGFALVLIVEGMVLFLGRRAGLVLGMLLLTLAVTLLNLVYVVMMLQKGYGPQLISILAVAFGGYIAIQQWSSLRLMRK